MFRPTFLAMLVNFDATLLGKTLGIEDAYRFAKGEQLTVAAG